VTIWGEDAYTILRDLIAGADDHRAWHIPDEIAGRARAFVAKETAQRESRAQSDARLEREMEDWRRVDAPAEPGQCGAQWYDIISLKNVVCILDPDHGADHQSRRVGPSAFTWPRS
jgi:hypothetical protein